MMASSGTVTMRLGRATGPVSFAFTNSSYAETSDDVKTELERLGFRLPSQAFLDLWRARTYID